MPKAEWILAYRAVVGSLPVTHRATLAHWLAFVNGQIDEHGSGLDAQTVAVEWSPALIHEVGAKRVCVWGDRSSM